MPRVDTKHTTQLRHFIHVPLSCECMLAPLGMEQGIMTRKSMSGDKLYLIESPGWSNLTPQSLYESLGVAVPAHLAQTRGPASHLCSLLPGTYIQVPDFKIFPSCWSYMHCLNYQTLKLFNRVRSQRCCELHVHHSGRLSVLIGSSTFKLRISI